MGGNVSTFDPQLDGTFIVSLLILTFLPIVLIVLYGLLLAPGRIGYMRTTREVQLPGEMIRVAQLLISRFNKLGFMLVHTPNPDSIRMTRPKRQIGMYPFILHTHASTKMEAEVRLKQVGGAVHVEAAMWEAKSVYMDTGEQRHIDQLLDRLLAAESAPWLPDPAPISNLSPHALTALAGGLILFVAALVQFLPWFNLLRAIGYMKGFGVGAFTSLVMGGLGLSDAMRRPKEMHGSWQAILGMALVVAAVIFAVFIFIALHGPEYQNWLQAPED